LFPTFIKTPNPQNSSLQNCKLFRKKALIGESMKIIDLSPSHPALLEQAARLLMDAFHAHWPNAWPDIDSAREEVDEALEPEKIARAALDEDGTCSAGLARFPNTRPSAGNCTRSSLPRPARDAA
jgi:hypothetical protein